MKCLKKYISVISILLFLPVCVANATGMHGTAVFANQLLDVSLSDELDCFVPRNEVYDFIDRMVARKAIGGIVKNTRPYSRGEVAAALVALAKKVDAGDVSLSDIERKRLMRLMHLFAVDSPYPNTSKSDANPGEYLLQTRGEGYQFGVSLEAGEIYNTVSGGIDVRSCPSDAYAGNWEGACQNPPHTHQLKDSKPRTSRIFTSLPVCLQHRQAK